MDSMDFIRFADLLIPNPYYEIGDILILTGKILATILIPVIITILLIIKFKKKKK